VETRATTMNPRNEEMKRLALIACLTAFCGAASAEDFKVPEGKTQAMPEAVLAEHIDALNHCDLNRIMAQYPDDGTFILSEGVWMEGRNEAVRLFSRLLKGLQGWRPQVRHVHHPIQQEERRYDQFVVAHGSALPERALQRFARLCDQGWPDARTGHDVQSRGHEIQRVTLLGSTGTRPILPNSLLS
jgi:SnoaL-like domain